MYCIIIDDADLPDAPTKFAPEGYRWAATSNAGLPKGKWWLTFLPESASTVDDDLAEKLTGTPTETERLIFSRLRSAENDE